MKIEVIVDSSVADYLKEDCLTNATIIIESGSQMLEEHRFVARIYPLSYADKNRDAQILYSEELVVEMAKEIKRLQNQQLMSSRIEALSRHRRGDRKSEGIVAQSEEDASKTEDDREMIGTPQKRDPRSTV